MMMRFFSSKASSELAKEMTKATKEVCKKLGVNSLSGIKVVEQPNLGDENVVSVEKFNSVFVKIPAERISANAEVAEEAMKNSPYY